MKKENRNKLLLMLAVLVLVMLACAELTVTNKTERPIRITVVLPDFVGPETVLLGANDSREFTSDTGGTYTLTAIVDDEYRARLTTLRDDATLLMFGKLKDLSANDIDKITRRLSNLSKLIENMNTVSCSGHLEEDGNANAEVVVNVNAGEIEVNCN